MIGRTKLSEIREELRQAFAAEGYNPIADLDREIRKLEKSKSGKPRGLRSLQLLRGALAQVIDEPKKPARSKRARTTKKPV
jgi:hypothetical protein